MFNSKSKFMAAVAICCLMASGLLSLQTSLAGTIGVNETVSLTQLLEGEEIIVGDKRFHNFEFNLSSGDLSPDDVQVTGIFDDVIDGFGLLFSGDFVAGGLSSPLLLEAGLAFTVEVLNDQFLISDVHLDGTTFVRGTGDARIVENFTGINVPSLVINELRQNGELLFSQSSDDILFSDVLDGVVGFKSIRVLKDIHIESGTNTPLDLAEITTFQQVFTQVEIPEPATWCLMAMALVGFASGRRNNLLR